MPRTVIFIAGTFPHAVADFLVEHGYIVLEAHDAEEALPLSNQTNVDAVIVAGGPDYPGLAELRQRRITVNLTIHATGPEVFFELTNILPTSQSRPQ